MFTSKFEARHAPKSWADLVFADPDVEDILRQYMLGNLHRNLILHGPPGTGKSSTAVLIAKGLTSTHEPSIWLEDTPHLWSRIDAFLNFGQTNAEHFGGSLYAIFEEVDQLKNNQDKLRSRMSQSMGVFFILTTNHLSKVQQEIRDRARPICMEAPNASNWLPRAKAILASEGVNLDDEAILKYLVANTGSMRTVMGALADLVELIKRKNPITPPPVIKVVPNVPTP